MILILGAGFIGTALGETFMSLGYPVRMFSRRPMEGGYFDDWIVGDLTEIDRFPTIFDGIDVVVHCIHSSVPVNSNKDLKLEVERNLVPTFKLIDMMTAHGVPSLFYLSSGGAVYGHPKMVPVAETATTLPISGYGATKLAIEQYLRLLHHQGRLDRLVIFRPANVYGVGQRLHKPQGVIGHLIRAAMTGCPFDVWGDGSAEKDYLHIDDFCRAVSRAVETPEVKQAIINVSSGRSLALREVIRIIEQRAGTRIPLRFGPPHHADVQSIALDNRLASELFGWEPLIGFEEGIEQTVGQLSPRAGINLGESP